MEQHQHGCRGCGRSLGRGGSHLLGLHPLCLPLARALSALLRSHQLPTLCSQEQPRFGSAPLIGGGGERWPLSRQREHCLAAQDELNPRQWLGRLRAASSRCLRVLGCPEALLTRSVTEYFAAEKSFLPLVSLTLLFRSPRCYSLPTASAAVSPMVKLWGYLVCRYQPWCHSFQAFPPCSNSPGLSTSFCLAA